ncbi:MAG: BCD family MFS transporter [Roseiflexaceae bacterium]
MSAVTRVFAGVTNTLRLALPKIGAGWMFAILTSHFNRVSIVELGVVAVVITMMIGMHHFLSPFQVVFGRMADRYPIFGYRRTPYFIIGSLIASLTFVFLPDVAAAMGQGQTWAFVAGFGLLFLFGIGIAATGDSHHALIAEVTDEKTRGIVVAVVWTFTIISAIAAAIFIKVSVSEQFVFAEMQSLYRMTPVVVMCAMLPILGIEKRRTKADLHALAATSATARVSPLQALSVAYTLIRTNTQVRAFFGFVFFSIVGIFLQDAILEVFGAEVFGMTIKQTSMFSSTWGGGVLGGMLLMGILSSVTSIPKKLIGLIGGFGTAFGLGLLTMTALTGMQSLLMPALIIMGVFTGFYNVGALSMMMDMTVEGSTGLYMGIWGMAQAFGMGVSSFASGTLKTLLIESGVLSPAIGYTAIFGLEVVLMVVGVAVLRSVDIQQFRSLSRADLTRAMEQGAGA